MAERFVFADEAGNFDFSLNSGASRYFILTTVTMSDCRTGDALAHLRRELTWKGINLQKPFHATDDTLAVRSAVFDLLKRSPIRVDATVLEKRKAEPHLRNELALYKMGWFMHCKFVAPQVATSEDRLLVVAASLGTKKTRSVQRSGGRRGSPGFARAPSRCILGRRQRPLYSGCRLLQLGRPALVGERRLNLP